MYRLKRSTGEFYATVADNVILGPNIPSTTPAPLNLVGRNIVSYGEAQNENFLWLAENFAGYNVPSASIRGQLWYDLTNDDGTGSGGELKIAPVDNATSREWLTVPVVAEMNSEPSKSHPGRMIIYKKDKLKIRMNNSWYQIATDQPKDKLFNSLLTINNNADMVDNEYTTVELFASSDYPVALFNEGGYIKEDGTIGGVDIGILKYGAVYQWEAEILGRLASDPKVFKTWKLKGSFVVDREGNQAFPLDPRKIIPFERNTLSYEVITETPGTSNWDVYARAGTTTPPSTEVPADVLESPYFGLEFVANANQTAGSIKTQWSILLRMTGIPSSTHPLYS